MEPSFKEQRIRKITHLYYSRPEIQEVIFNFSGNREVVPSFMMESFGKRPDSFQYKGDLFELVRRGATSFHCSEELWEDPLKIKTGMSEEELNNLRIGWDLLVDIDSKYIDYSKILADIIIKMLKFHGLKNIGIKFSGSKGFHIIIPWKSFPKKIYNNKSSDMFPEWPRILTNYIINQTKKPLIDEISNLTKPNKYIKDFEASEQVMPDLILVSPRHLFRMPYSLHEKTALASIVLSHNEILNFELKDADPMKLSKDKIKNFYPDSEEGEAKELMMQALDWHKENNKDEGSEKKKFDYKPIKLINFSDAYFPPSIQKILKGINDGRKRALFILINLFRSISMERDELEKRIDDWNKKNTIPLKSGYIKAQLTWSYRNKIVLPPNFDKDYYRGVGVVPTEEELRFKNPVNYIVKKSLLHNKENSKTSKFKKQT